MGAVVTAGLWWKGPKFSITDTSYSENSLPALDTRDVYIGEESPSSAPETKVFFP